MATYKHCRYLAHTFSPYIMTLRYAETNFSNKYDLHYSNLLTTLIHIWKGVHSLPEIAYKVNIS